MLHKHIYFNEQTITELKTDAQKLVDKYAQSKWSFLLESKHTHKILWHPAYGLYIHPIPPHEEVHRIIAEKTFGKDQALEWHPGIIKIQKNKDNSTSVSVYGESSTSEEFGTLPNIPPERYEQFITDMCDLFKNISFVTTIKVGVGTTFISFDCLNQKRTFISGFDFRK